MKVRMMLFLAVLFASCTKEESLEIIDNPGSGQLQGNYVFLSMQAHTNATVELKDGIDKVLQAAILKIVKANVIDSYENIFNETTQKIS